jgi:DNA polymerase III delta prime subunit
MNFQPERFAKLGIDPPKGILLFGPPGTGKTLCARAVANRTDATFIRVIGSELVQKYVGEGARMVRELFEMARSKKACIIFFDEIDAIGGARFDDGAGGDNEVQRTMLELINQLDGFDPRGNIKVLMATNRSVHASLVTGPQILNHHLGQIPSTQHYFDPGVSTVEWSFRCRIARVVHIFCAYTLAGRSLWICDLNHPNM